jgi:hypothetical protein
MMRRLYSICHHGDPWLATRETSLSSLSIIASNGYPNTRVVGSDIHSCSVADMLCFLIIIVVVGIAEK